MKKRLNTSLLTLCLIISLGVSSVIAQTVKWDSTYRPGKYVELVAKFKAESPVKNEYIFLGNSITAGTDWAKLL
ncbi:MAG: sialate O-acetylesterase, partial [Chitinophagaceae bacterium]